MKKIVISIAIVTTLLFTTGAGASSNKWKTWDNHMTPTFNRMDQTYKEIGTALVTNQVAQAEYLFEQYSVDTFAFVENDSSPSKLINLDIQTVGLLSNTWAWTGYKTLVGNWPTAAFVTINTRLLAALKKFTHDLLVYG